MPIIKPENNTNDLNQRQLCIRMARPEPTYEQRKVAAISHSRRYVYLTFIECKAWVALTSS